MKDYIKRTYNTDRKEYYLFNQIPVFILNELPSNISVEEIINILEDYIPSFLFKGLDGVYVGDFQELNDRNVQALFKDDAIYLSSFRDGDEISEELLAREVTHELAHSLEQKLSNEIYSDGRIENEYNAKKEWLSASGNEASVMWERKLRRELTAEQKATRFFKKSVIYYC